MLDERRANLETAKAGVEAAKEADAEAVAEAIRTNSAMPVGKTREARSVELSADDDVRGAEAALKTLDRQRQRLFDAQRATQQQVRKQVNATLAPTVMRFCDEVEAAQRRVLMLRHVIDVLASMPVGVFLDDFLSKETMPSHERAMWFATDSAPTIAILQELKPLRQKFEAARKALHENPDTVIPDVP